MQLNRQIYNSSLDAFLVLQAIVFVLYVRNGGESDTFIATQWFVTLATLLIQSELGGVPWAESIRLHVHSAGRTTFYVVGLACIVLSLLLPTPIKAAALVIIYGVFVMAVVLSWIRWGWSKAGR